MKKVQKIKDNITDKQFTLLTSSLRSDISIRNIRKNRLLKVFSLLYYLGIRVNETSQFTNQMIIELLTNKKLIISSHKQNSEKYIYLTNNSHKQLNKLFKDIPNNNHPIICSERGRHSTMCSVSLIRDVNSYLKKVFGQNTRITSHSFRQTLISNLATAGINTKIIQNLIGHKSINTTYRYIKTDEVNLVKSLEIVR